MAQKLDGTEDLRIRRTRKLLLESLIKLTVEKGFAAITVRDITERAMVNRSTFYRHYLDKYDLLIKYFDDLQAQISEAALLAEKTAALLAEKTGQTGPEKVPSGLLVLINHVQEYADFYRVMLGTKGDPVFTQHFRQMAETRYRALFARFGGVTDPNAPPIDMKLSYISAASVGAFSWWLENDQPCTPEQLATWLGQLSMTSAGLLRKPDGS